MIALTVNKSKLDKLIRNLNKFAQSLDYRKPLTRAVEVLRYEQTQNFAQQGRIYGTWKKLAPSTRSQRAKLGYNPARPILERTGALRRGFESFVLSSTLAKVTNTVEYAAYHQTGTSKMPQRKIVGISRKSRRAIGLVFANFIAGKIREHFYK